MIVAQDLKFFRSERMTDETDGGGRMTATEIVSGQENQIFDDITDVDWAAGDVSIRKIYGAVASATDDRYLDAGFVVLSPPTDERVSVSLFSTGDYYDERTALKTKLESGISRGALYLGWLWGQHIAGQRAITIWQRVSLGLPAVGQRLEVVARSGSTTLRTQMLWVTRVVDELIERADEKGTYQVRSVVCEIAEPLQGDYLGVEPTRIDPALPASLIYETRYNQDAVAIVGIRPFAQAASVGDYTVKIDSLYEALIPTAFAETAITDTTPGGSTISLVQARATSVSFTTTEQVVKPDASLYLQMPAMPGSLTITVSGATITDVGGMLMLSGYQIGTVDYGNGVCLWTSSCPNYGTATKTVAFIPAAIPTPIQDTASQVVTVENRGFVWVLTLAPIPAPGTLRVSYRVNDAWYTLFERGDGQLFGVDSSYGSGSLNFSTGTVTITCGAEPDPDSEIVYAWSTPVLYTDRSLEAVSPVRFYGQTANPGVATGTASFSWTVGATTYSVSDNGAGALSGTGGSGKINYATGEWYIQPTTIPPKGTEVTVAYSWGDPVTETFEGPVRNGSGDIVVTLNDTPNPASVFVEWDLDIVGLAEQLGIEVEYSIKNTPNVLDEMMRKIWA